MRVKVKDSYKESFRYVYGTPDSWEFDVESQDDGFWTDVAFYAGSMYINGDRFHVSLDQKHCEVIRW